MCTAKNRFRSERFRHPMRAARMITFSCRESRSKLNASPRGRRTNNAFRQFASRFETRLAVFQKLHAQRGIEGQKSMRWQAHSVGVAGGIQKRPAHRQHDQCENRRANKQKNDLLDAYSPRMAASGCQQETHRGPAMFFVLPTVEQVNQQRDTGQREPGEQPWAAETERQNQTGLKSHIEDRRRKELAVRVTITLMQYAVCDDDVSGTLRSLHQTADRCESCGDRNPVGDTVGQWF